MYSYICYHEVFFIIVFIVWTRIYYTDFFGGFFNIICDIESVSSLQITACEIILNYY